MIASSAFRFEAKIRCVAAMCISPQRPCDGFHPAIECVLRMGRRSEAAGKRSASIKGNRMHLAFGFKTWFERAPAA